MDEPLIYTSKGNVPIKDLRYETKWVFYPDVSEVSYWDEKGVPIRIPDAVTFHEMWFDADGTLVKNNAHQMSFKGLPAIGVVQQQIQ